VVDELAPRELTKGAPFRCKENKNRGNNQVGVRNPNKRKTRPYKALFEKTEDGSPRGEWGMDPGRMPQGGEG